MNSSSLKEVLERAAFWPSEDQNELIQAANLIEKRNEDVFQLNDDDWKIINARIAASKLSGLASEAEENALFGKYRRP